MQNNNTISYIKSVLDNLPSDWLDLTTHRLDIYNEKKAKVNFLDDFESLYKSNKFDMSSLSELQTAYDYIRLGHPLSCVLEWTIGQLNRVNAECVISFSSVTIGILAVLRKNSLIQRKTRIIYRSDLPDSFDAEVLKSVYQYSFDLLAESESDVNDKYNGSTILISGSGEIYDFDISNSKYEEVDFCINMQPELGSILLVNGKENEEYISEIQHVRRRETIAMTPANCLSVLRAMVSNSMININNEDKAKNKTHVLDTIKEVTGINTQPIVGSSGLSIQYAIMMGLINDAIENHEGKSIKFIVPPNCYGGTNDQARRVATCVDNVEVVDLPVDGGNDMVKSLDTVLAKIATEDAIPFIIAEIPTNPRVEVPNLQKLKEVLSAERKTAYGTKAIDPVFILDQTFCPNVHFLGEGEILSSVRAISYASGSKFPSGGKCTAGYCVANDRASSLMNHIENHLMLCDNEATSLQYEILSSQLPSMLSRIDQAYKNTREFVSYIHKVLPDAKINFVSEDLAVQGFTPSVFSLDLPTKGSTDEERESYKRALNLKLINLMITEIPDESKFCVSYGQLKGCYWTIPATSTQGTTKEGDKDYIVRASLSAHMNMELHKKVFMDFVDGI